MGYRVSDHILVLGCISTRIGLLADLHQITDAACTAIAGVAWSRRVIRRFLFSISIGRLDHHALFKQACARQWHTTGTDSLKGMPPGCKVPTVGPQEQRACPRCHVEQSASRMSLRPAKPERLYERKIVMPMRWKVWPRPTNSCAKRSAHEPEEETPLGQHSGRHH